MKRTTEPAATPITATTSVVVNGKSCEPSGPPGRSLLAFLRVDLGLTGTKPGCGEGACGACTVLIDGAAVLACRTTVGEVAGRSVTTIEGLAGAGTPSSRPWRRSGHRSAGTARPAWRCGPRRCWRRTLIPATTGSLSRWGRTCAGAGATRG